MKFQRDITISVCVTAACSWRKQFFRRFLLWKKIEKRVWLKFYIWNGITATELLKIPLKRFGESTSSRTQVFEWWTKLCLKSSFQHYLLCIDSRHFDSCFGYKARGRQILTKRLDFLQNERWVEVVKEMRANVDIHFSHYYWWLNMVIWIWRRNCTTI